MKKDNIITLGPSFQINSCNLHGHPTKTSKYGFRSKMKFRHVGRNEKIEFEPIFTSGNKMD
jgi:hypothetical protein